MVVDIENVVGGAVRTAAQAAWARLRVVEALDLQPGEQVTVGTSHVGLLNTRAAWPGARIVVRSGEDGADRALLEVLLGELIEERFDELALVSGDGIFADAVAALGAAGLKVTVASWRELCSKRLRMAASRTVFFDDSALAVGGAA